MRMQKTKKNHIAPAEKTSGAPSKFQKPENQRLAMDESTIDRLLALRRKATEKTQDLDIDRGLFASLLKNQNAAVATMRIDGKLEGYIVATPINEGWVKGDVQEIKDVMKPTMDAWLFEKISKAMDIGPCYYLDDFLIAKRGDALLDMVESFHSQLDSNSAKFLLVHGMILDNRYKIYKSIIKSGGFAKIHENVHPNWFGGEDFMLMVFEKA